MSLLSCQQPVKNNSTVNVAKDSDTLPSKSVKQAFVKPVYNEALLQQYANFLGNLDTTDLEGSTNAAKKYVELFKNQDKNTCDSAFFIYNDKYYSRLTRGLDSLHQADSTMNYDSLLNTSDYHHLSYKLASYAKRLKDNGFMVYESEGETYIVEDLDFLAKWFYPNVSTILKEYLLEINKENKEGFSEDAELTITPQQLVDRTVWWGNFYSKNPNYIIIEKAEDSWKDYLRTLMEGMDNTPVLTSNKSLDKYYKTAYDYLKKSYPTSQTTKLVIPYFDLLLQKQSVKAAVLLKKYEKEKIISN